MGSKHARAGVGCRPTWVSGRPPPSLRTCSIAPSWLPRPPSLDRRLHLHLDGGRLALCCSGRRLVLASGRRLVDERSDDRAARDGCLGDGDLAARQARCSGAPLGSRQSVQQRAVPAADGRSRCRLFDEALGQRLGQCRDGELLLLAQNRTNRAEDVPEQRRGQGRRVRLHRALLQCETSALHDRVPKPDGVRAESRIRFGRCHPNRVQAIPPRT